MFALAKPKCLVCRSFEGTPWGSFEGGKHWFTYRLLLPSWQHHHRFHIDGKSSVLILQYASGTSWLKIKEDAIAQLEKRCWQRRVLHCGFITFLWRWCKQVFDQWPLKFRFFYTFHYWSRGQLLSHISGKRPQRKERFARLEGCSCFPAGGIGGGEGQWETVSFERISRPRLVCVTLTRMLRWHTTTQPDIPIHRELFGQVQEMLMWCKSFFIHPLF